MSQDSETPEQPETPETPAEPTQPPAQPPAPPAMPPPTTPPVAQPAAPVAGGVSPGQGGLAIASFVCGIVGVLTSVCCIGLVFAIAAVVCGILGKKEAETRGVSSWMWITGLVLGAVTVALFLIWVVIIGVGSFTPSTDFNSN